MPVLVTSNFDDDSIKNERASMETAFSHYNCMGIFRRSRAVAKFELVRDFMHVLVTCSIKRIGSKTTEKRWRHRFPHYKSVGTFCCYGNQSLDTICPKTLCSLSPTPVMLHIKLIKIGQLASEIFKFESVVDDGRTNDGTLVYL